MEPVAEATGGRGPRPPWRGLWLAAAMEPVAEATGGAGGGVGRLEPQVGAAMEPVAEATGGEQEPQLIAHVAQAAMEPVAEATGGLKATSTKRPGRVPQWSPSPKRREGWLTLRYSST